MQTGKENHTLMMLSVLRQLLGKFIHWAQLSEEVREKSVLWGWLLCETCWENTGKCDFCMTFAGSAFTMRKIWGSTNSSKVKLDSIPNVKFPAMGIGEHLSPGSHLFACVLYLRLNQGWGKGGSSGKAITFFITPSSRNWYFESHRGYF